VTIDERRLLNWDGCANARDLGGYPTEDGGETQWRRILRSDNPHDLTEAGRQALLDSGVGAIIDVRGDGEVDEYPSPFAEHPRVLYQHIPFVDETKPWLPEGTSMADVYLHMLHRDHVGIAAILTAIARAPDAPVLIHCHGGKDRTGLISALLLRLVGVPIDVADADYALTEELMTEKDRAWIESAPTPEVAEERRRNLITYAPRREVMDHVLRTLDERHGSAEAYMRWAGVEQADIDRLRARLLG
jgi:protein tyrosine/serine phosphatase